MQRSTQYLLLALGGSGVLWLLSRTEKGAAAVVAVTDTVAKALTPRGIRNNNPGNIEWIQNSAARWRGMVSADGRYGIFDTAANGVRAIGGELAASIRKGQTIEQAIHEWAPPTENNTAAYVAAVARAVGVAPSVKLARAHIPAATLAIIKHENGIQPYNPADVAAWVFS